MVDCCLIIRQRVECESTGTVEAFPFIASMPPFHMQYEEQSTVSGYQYPAQVEEYRMRRVGDGGYPQFYVCMYACMEDKRRLDKTKIK
jgi:hypothetical protein